MDKSLIDKFKQNNNVTKFVKYGFVGVLGTLVHTTILTISVEILHISPILSTVLGFMGSLILSFKLNSMWTFKGDSRTKYSFLKYIIICLIGLLINVCIMTLIVKVLHSTYLIGQGISILVVPIFNFILSSYWAFSKKMPK